MLLFDLKLESYNSDKLIVDIIMNFDNFQILLLHG